MVERRRFLSRVVVMAIAFIVGCSMILGTSTVEASAASKAPSKVTIYSYGSVNHNTVVVKWRAAKGAKKYEVYRATSKNGKYKKVKTTTAKSFTNTGLTTGKNYYYKVRAVSKSGKKGKFSYKKVVKPMLNTPSLKVNSTAETYAVISHSAVKGASGYQVYKRASGASSYTKVGAYKESTIKVTGLKENTKYYFKVRAYKKVGGKYVYSNFSSVKGVTTDKHTCKWVPVKGTDGTVTRDKCSVCGEVRAHNHTWVEQKEWVDPGTGHYEQDTNYYFICGICADNHIWTDLSGDADFRYNHQLEHALAGELGSGNHDAQKDLTYTNLTEEDLQIWVPDPKVEKVVGYKCSTCGTTK